MTRTYISIILAGLLLTALWGCGSSNSGAPAFMAGTHPTGWSAGISHGKASLDLAKREQCTECHGRDLRGGISKVSCYACHGTYPHPAGWEDPAQHGAAYKTNSDQCRAYSTASHAGGPDGRQAAPRPGPAGGHQRGQLLYLPSELSAPGRMGGSAGPWTSVRGESAILHPVPWPGPAELSCLSPQPGS